MGMSVGNEGGGSMMAEINVTPLVDVMLVLLIIFMVTAPLLQQGVEVALPKASAPGLKQAEETTLVITVHKDQKIYMANTLLEIPEMQEKLQLIATENPNKQVFLKADKDVPYGSVVQVMAAIRRAGISRLGMVTQPGDEATP